MEKSAGHRTHKVGLRCRCLPSSCSLIALGLLLQLPQQHLAENNDKKMAELMTYSSFTQELSLKMSWQSYVDDHMSVHSPSPFSVLPLTICDAFFRVATQNVRQGAILGLAGGGAHLPIIKWNPFVFRFVASPTAFLQSKCPNILTPFFCSLGHLRWLHHRR
jgi:hypothetical protein